ncbi:NAD(P)-dependent oxidoreductase [Alkalihalobacillus sp. TS-13]|uniref:NAD-dependent epimerase/dehydratase family protein n=1 Tax=Alkalihalobacillus sp. TS-13 TaxID=2842455 RepID=UPI001C87A6EE|nr:NAD(P)-dependent oxidoreductase [Alkalihalobacillus sp. TS-13]
MKNTLITGVAGELGMLLCNEFLNDEIDVYGIDHLDREGHVGLDLIGRNALFHFYNLPIQEVDWDDIEQPRTIFHLAQTSPKTNQLSELKTILQNQQQNMRKVIQYAAEQNSKIILISTTDVYGNSRPPFQADRTPQPNSLYGTLMLTEETYLTETAEVFDVDYHIMRIPMVNGCRNSIEERCFAVDKLEKAGVSDQNREISNTFTITKETFIMSCNQLMKGEYSDKIITLYEER